MVFILIRHTKNTSKRKDSLSPATVARLVASIIGIMSLLGMMWLFAALTFQFGDDQTVRNIFQTLFTLSASFQGFFVFVFFCLLNKVARELWKELLCCGKYRSKLLHPQTHDSSRSNAYRLKSANTKVCTLPTDPTPTHTAAPSPSPSVEKQADEYEHECSVINVTWVGNGDGGGDVQSDNELGNRQSQVDNNSTLQ